MIAIEKMTKAKFEQFLFNKVNQIMGYRKLTEEQTVCHLYYLSGKHIGTWTKNKSFISESLVECVA